MENRTNIYKVLQMEIRLKLINAITVTYSHLQSLAVICSHLQSFAVTCSHFQSLSVTCSHLQSFVMEMRLAITKQKVQCIIRSAIFELRI